LGVRKYKATAYNKVADRRRGFAQSIRETTYEQSIDPISNPISINILLIYRLGGRIKG